MLQFLKNILKPAPKVALGELIANGATIVDVRTAREYATGHIKGSVNIPLDALSSQLKKIKKDKPVITCCASGMRSSSARAILKSNGFTDVHNAGSWFSLKKYER